MNYLEDILTQAQQGRAMDNLARAYGISPAEAQRAVQAALPAFAVGLQRSAATPQGFAELLGAMSRNPYAQAFENPSAGLGGEVRAQGNDALAAMFGSPDVSRAVAAQASAASGLSQELLKQMLPAIASLVLGGLMKGGAGGGLGDLLGGVLGGGASGQQPRGGSTGNPLQDILGGMLGGGRTPAPQPGGTSGGSPGASTGNPLEDLLGGVLGGMLGGGRTPAPQQGGNTAGPTGNPLDDLLGSIFGGGAAPRQRAGRDEDADAGFDPFGADRTPTGGNMPSGGQTPTPRPGGSGDPLQDLLGGILGGMFGGGAAAGTGSPAPRGEAGGSGQAQDPRLQPFQDIFDQFTKGQR